MEVYFWSGLRVANDSGVPPVIKVTFPPRPENATAVDAVQEANENFYNILALSVGITGRLTAPFLPTGLVPWPSLPIHYGHGCELFSSKAVSSSAVKFLFKRNLPN